MNARPNVMACRPLPSGRKSFAGDLVSGQHVRIDRWPKPRRNYQLARRELQWLRKQPHLWFQKPIELAGVADGDARDARLHPAAELAGKAVAEHRLHAGAAHRIECFAEQVETAEAFQLELAEAHVRNCGGALDVRELADRLVQHDR